MKVREMGIIRRNTNKVKHFNETTGRFIFVGDGEKSCIVNLWKCNNGHRDSKRNYHSKTILLTFSQKDENEAKFIKNTIINTLLKKGIIDLNFLTKISYGPLVTTTEGMHMSSIVHNMKL